MKKQISEIGENEATWLNAFTTGCMWCQGEFEGVYKEENT